MSDDKRSRRQTGIEESLAAARERAAQAETRYNESKAELERCERQRPRVDALRDLVRALEALREQEGECPIFGGPIDPARYDRLLTAYRPEVESFDEQVPRLRQSCTEAEAEWRAASTDIGEIEHKLEKELQRQRRQEREERRQALLERARQLTESGAEPLRELKVGWGGETEDDRRHRRVALLVLLLTFVLSALVPMIQLPAPDLAEEREIPERLARLVVEREQQPEPEPEPVVEEEPEEEEEVVEEPEEEEETEVAEAEPEPIEEPPEEVTETAEVEARERASETGLLALSDELEELASASVEDKLGDQASITEEGAEATEVSRDIVTAEAAETSGGIQTDQLSRNVGSAGGSVGDRETSRVESGLAEQTARAQRDARTKEGRKGRTDEEIQIVFDRNKSALYRIYNRALRTDPSLEGKVTLKLTIEPSGRVSACEVVSSELDTEDLERKIVQRVRLFDFGAKDVPAVTITYPIDFLPA